MYNFERHTSLTIGQRSPFIIELDLFWLSDEKQYRLEGLVRFIEHILNSDDYRHVYFVSIEQALEWLKYPRPLSEIEQFWAFGCKDTIYEYDIDCSQIDFDDENNSKLTKNSQHLKSDNNSNETDLPWVDRRAEELFRSDIVIHCIWVFFLSIFSVLFYDKYLASK